MQVKPAKQPLANSHPASEKEEARICDKPMPREYMCKKERKAAHVVETLRGRMKRRHLMHFLYMGIMENADPHPSDTFEVTLRGEQLSRHWTRRSKATEKGKFKCRKTP